MIFPHTSEILITVIELDDVGGAVPDFQSVRSVRYYFPQSLWSHQVLLGPGEFREGGSWGV